MTRNKYNPREVAVDVLIESMKQRYPEKGFLLHPNISFTCSSNDTNNRRSNGNSATDNNNDNNKSGTTTMLGVIATSDIAKDEILLVIPEDALFCVENVIAVSTTPTTTKDNDVDISFSLKRIIDKVKRKCQTAATQQLQLFSQDDFATALAMMYILGERARGVGDNLFTKQADTWPSVDDMKQTSIFYLNLNLKNKNKNNNNGGKDNGIDFETSNNGNNKSAILEGITFRLNAIRAVFDRVIYPVLKEEAAAGDNDNDEAVIIRRFCMNPTTTTNNNNNLRDETWETFRYAFSLVFSRAHEDCDGGSPTLCPLIELFNGDTSTTTSKASAINVDIAQGKWPFLKGSLFRDDCNLACSAIHAMRDITKGEELILSYGDLIPMDFLTKYGTIPRHMIVHDDDNKGGSSMPPPDIVCIWCPPDQIPTDPLRVQALEVRNQYPLEDMKAGTAPLTTLTGEGFFAYLSSFGRDEYQEFASMRQYLILANLASDAEVQRNIDTGRLRVERVTARAIGTLLLHTLDYNLKLLGGESSKADMKLAEQKEEGLASGLLLGRICQRETLLQWKRLVCLKYGMEDVIDNACCRRCGRSYPQLKCTRCKWRGESLCAHYCSREHQKLDWKTHKRSCKTQQGK